MGLGREGGEGTKTLSCTFSLSHPYEVCMEQSKDLVLMIFDSFLS